MKISTETKTTQRMFRRGTKEITTNPSKRGATIGSRLKILPNDAVMPDVLEKAAARTRLASIVSYYPRKGVDDFVRQVSNATPMELVEAERKGVAGYFLKDLSKRMEMPAARIFTMLGVPKATAEKKAATGDVVSGSGGQAAIGVAKLLGTAQAIVANSTAAGAADFDSAKWLGHWLERPQPALGGRKPADLIDTPTGIEVVSKLLGAIESGAFQ